MMLPIDHQPNCKRKKGSGGLNSRLDIRSTNYDNVGIE